MACLPLVCYVIGEFPIESAVGRVSDKRLSYGRLGSYPIGCCPIGVRGGGVLLMLRPSSGHPSKDRFNVVANWETQREWGILLGQCCHLHLTCQGRIWNYDKGLHNGFLQDLKTRNGCSLYLWFSIMYKHSRIVSS